MVKYMKQAKTLAAKERIALFGGSFDPVHCAHLEVARCALKQEGLGRVIFLPAAQSPLKQKPFSDKNARLEMLRLALKNEVKFELSTYEIEQNVINYTVDTVSYFNELYSGSELFWIIGQDQFSQLCQWHRIDELVKKIIFLVYPRGNPQTDFECPVSGICYRLLDAKTMSTSSTTVRDQCKKGLSISGMVPDAVEAFIYKKSLYKEN